MSVKAVPCPAAQLFVGAVAEVCIETGDGDGAGAAAVAPASVDASPAFLTFSRRGASSGYMTSAAHSAAAAVQVVFDSADLTRSWHRTIAIGQRRFYV